MRFRRLTDIRTTPLLIGLIAVAWALVPILDAQDRTLFAQVLEETGREHLWLSILFTLGLFLAVSSICKWRRMLLLTQSFNVFVWLSLFVAFRDYALLTPVVLVMPLFSLSCGLCLWREVVFGCRFIRGRRSGFSEFLEKA